jgi:hypothetical protein
MHAVQKSKLADPSAELLSSSTGPTAGRRPAESVVSPLPEPPDEAPETLPGVASKPMVEWLAARN